jgi:alpha-L-fucosidase
MILHDRSSWVLPDPGAGLSLRRTPATLQEIQRVAQQGPWQPTDASLAEHETVASPKWFAQAKFGIFTHWGLYTVPEWGNEWYSRNMYIQGYPEHEHQRDVMGGFTDHGYKSFITRFTAPRFDPDAWLDAFTDAGARYYFPVAEHHDGFQMYRTRLSHWNAYEKGPKRDVIGELRRSTLAHGLHFALSNHRAEHWWFMSHGMEFDSDIRREAEAGQKRWLAAHPGASLKDVPYRGLQHGSFYWPAMPEPQDEQDMRSKPTPTAEYLEDWLLRVCELIDSYHPNMLYFDWWMGHEAFRPYVRLMAAYYYNRAEQWHQHVSICFKDNCLPWGAGTVDVERGGFQSAQPFVWQTDTSITRTSWCYCKGLDYKPAGELLRVLLDTVSKNGNLLLNVGPRADGSLGSEEKAILSRIGTWMHANGQAVYGTRPWRITQEGPTGAGGGAFNEDTIHYGPHDVRFTTKHDTIYAIFLAPGTESELTCQAFGQRTEKITPAFHGILGSVRQIADDGTLHDVPYRVDEAGMHIQRLPGQGLRDGDDVLPLVFAINER